MKKYLLLFAAVTITVTAMAQGNSQGKGKMKSKHNKESKIKDKYEHEDNREWEGNEQKTGKGKFSKNQPAKVRAAFQRDYPNANNVAWSKYKGDWTATFNSRLGRSTAVYHANGERRDTRTRITRDQLPNETIWDKIFRRDRVNPVGNIVQIESPSLGSNIFRIASQLAGSKTQYRYYDSNGQLVEYDY